MTGSKPRQGRKLVVLRDLMRSRWCSLPSSGVVCLLNLCKTRRPVTHGACGLGNAETVLILLPRRKRFGRMGDTTFSKHYRRVRVWIHTNAARRVDIGHLARRCHRAG